MLILYCSTLNTGCKHSTKVRERNLGFLIRVADVFSRILIFFIPVLGFWIPDPTTTKILEGEKFVAYLSL
jgi:hypothetical protein